MMPLPVDTFLDDVGISVTDFVLLSSEERKAVIDNLPERRLSDLKGELDEIRTKIAALHEGRGRPSGESRKEMRQLEKDLDLLFLLISGEESDRASLIRDVTNGSDINLSPASIQFKGETYIYNMSKTGALPTEVEEKIGEGETAETEERAADDENPEPARDMGALQNVFLDFGPDVTVSFVTIDRKTHSYTLRLESADGVAFVTFNNASHVSFNIAGPTLQPESEIAFAARLPEDLAKRIYIGMSPESIFDQLEAERTSALS